MLTRREVLDQLKRMGVKEPSQLKDYLRDFEKYMEINYGMKIMKTGEKESKDGKRE